MQRYTGIGRRELLVATGLLASVRTEACSLVEPTAFCNEVLAEFLKRVAARDFARSDDVLHDEFTFKKSIAAQPVDRAAFLDWLDKEPAVNRDGVQSSLIDQSPDQIVQRELVHYQDTPDRRGACGFMSNNTRRIAVYEFYGVDQGAIRLRPRAKFTGAPPRQLDRFAGTRIRSLLYIGLPFELDG